MTSIRVVPLGAGQDVGRSCIIVSLGHKNIMLDCGMHMGYKDSRRFPDFSYLSRAGDYDSVIDLVCVSHFHLDHCGALPHFTEMCGYHGPIVMSVPTKAICPILLEDFRKIAVERRGLQKFFTSAMIKTCMSKVTAVNLHETLVIEDGFEVTAYYAGHVLGAVMFHVRVGEQSFVYTGDYNLTPDRHLGGAWIDCVRPDLLITETTYATFVRDSKRSREQDFLNKVKGCVDKGGKVLIPVFALGRAQELCILLDAFWTRMNMTVPIYFAQGLTARATEYYKLFTDWTNQAMKDTFVERNQFDFAHIAPFERSALHSPGPVVVFATPGMLHAGLSLEVFMAWAEDPRNMVILPGYCVAGTVGNDLISGKRRITANGATVDVRCTVSYMSFSAHVDQKGIMQLIRHTQPANVMLVHGERAKMDVLKQKIMHEFDIPCVNPANGTSVTLQPRPTIHVDVAASLLRESVAQAGPTVEPMDIDEEDSAGSSTSGSSSSSSSSSAQKRRAVPLPAVADAKRVRLEGTFDSVIDGVLVAQPGQPLHLLSNEQVSSFVGLPGHTVDLEYSCMIDAGRLLELVLPGKVQQPSLPVMQMLMRAVPSLSRGSWTTVDLANVRCKSVHVTFKRQVAAKELALEMAWNVRDDAVAEAIQRDLIRLGLVVDSEAAP